MVLSLLTVALAACASLVSATTAGGLHRFALPLAPSPEGVPTATSGNGTFTQLIDHDHPEKGTFQQRYWWNDQFWAGPGSPVVLFTPGEVDASGYVGYLTNRTITGAFAQSVKGATIILEHRYWGESSPYSDLTTKNLQALTVKNAIADLTNFARTVKLPFDASGKTNAPKAPWILAGGSYSGALSAWVQKESPGTFWAHHASSAPVEAIYDYWQYFYPVQQGMPQNCSADVTKVINFVDQVLQSKNDTAKNALKAKFGLPGLHDSDFAAGITNGPWAWQSNYYDSGYTAFYNWCDWVENAVDISGGSGNASTIIPPSAKGVGLQKALDGYAAYVRTQIVPGYCASYGSVWTSNTDLGCFDTYNKSSPIFTDTSVGNAFERQWTWILCNEPLAYWQDGAPSSDPTIVSRFVNAAYWQRQCSLYFPTEKDSSGTYTYGSNAGRTVDKYNKVTSGWEDTSTKRLLWVNGEFDPWRSSGVSSHFRPEGPLKSTSAAPVYMIPGGIHCYDLILPKAGLYPQIQAVVNQELAQMKAWVTEFYHPHSRREIGA